MMEIEALNIVNSRSEGSEDFEYKCSKEEEEEAPGGGGGGGGGMISVAVKWWNTRRLAFYKCRVSPSLPQSSLVRLWPVSHGDETSDNN